MLIKKINGLDLPTGGSYLSILETTEKILIEKDIETVQNLTIDNSLILNGSIIGNNNNPISINSPINTNGDVNIVGDVNITGRYLINGNPFTVTPGGTNNQLQYNNNGILDGIPDVTYEPIQTPNGSINGLQASFINITNVLHINSTANLIVDGNLEVNGEITGLETIEIGSSINVQGNVSGQNANFSGNIVANNISTNGNISADTISASSNISTNGIISAYNISVNGNISADTISASSSISTNGIISAYSISVNGNISAGSISATGGISTEGNISATHNISADYVTANYILAGNSISAYSISAAIKNAIVETQNYGTRLTYCMEAPTVRFYDEGKDTLVNGEKRIDLDPIFLETIEGELYIHVTPNGPASLYISEKGTNYFVVKSLGGNDVEFCWMVSATRKGYTGVRLEEFKGYRK
jgi:cytoskeletal protein CcmA (bactofilin family)